jgi:GT2 family glycosyltransferase
VPSGTRADDDVPALSVVITTHSRSDLLGDCLESVRRAGETLGEPLETLVVDDGGQAGLTEIVGERSPDAVLLVTDGNLGFAGAAAHGMRQARAEWIALLNDDVTVEPDALVWMLQAARSAPDVGSVAAQMRFADRPAIINSAGIEVDTLAISSDRLVGARAEASEDGPTDVFGASAGAALYRRAMLDDTGGLDVGFFAYLDDIDLAWRARMCGWRCLYAPRAVVYHRHSATFGHGSPRKHFLSGRNRVRLVAKNASAGQLLRYGWAMVLYDLAYVAFVGVRERTLQPARGRLQGLREWRRYRAAGRDRRRPVPLVRRLPVRAALARDRAWPRSPAG